MFCVGDVFVYVSRCVCNYACMLEGVCFCVCVCGGHSNVIMCVCVCVTSDPSYLASPLWDYTVNEKRGKSERGMRREVEETQRIYYQ